MSTASPISPSNDELADALRTLRADNPSTGAAKLLAKLLQTKPTWTVSEKRLRKTLQQEGLATIGSSNGHPPSGNEAVSFPVSHVVTSLDPNKWTQKVRVEFFGPHKGKGLVTTEAIAENENIWVEDPILLSPESYVVSIWGCFLKITYSHMHNDTSESLMICNVGHKHVYTVPSQSVAPGGIQWSVNARACFAIACVRLEAIPPMRIYALSKIRPPSLSWIM